MAQYAKEELSEARRAIASTRSKSEKALLKLREGTAQRAMTERAVDAYRIAMDAIDRAMGDDGAVPEVSREEGDIALSALALSAERVERILPRFSEGTPQHTLAIRRLQAFAIAAALIREERLGRDDI